MYWKNTSHNERMGKLMTTEMFINIVVERAKEQFGSFTGDFVEFHIDEIISEDNFCGYVTIADNTYPMFSLRKFSVELYECLLNIICNLLNDYEMDLTTSGENIYSIASRVYMNELKNGIRYTSRFKSIVRQSHTIVLVYEWDLDYLTRQHDIITLLQSTGIKR